MPKPMKDKILPTIAVSDISPSRIRVEDNCARVRTVVVPDDDPSGDGSTLGKLAEDIQENGIQTPLWVRPGDKKGYYILVAGHRRLNAAKKIKLKKVPCVVREDLETSEQAFMAAVCENTKRETLDDYDILKNILMLSTLDPKTWVTKGRKGTSKDTVIAPSAVVNQLGITTAKARRYSSTLGVFSEQEIEKIQEGIVDQGTNRPVTWVKIMTLVVAQDTGGARRLAQRVYPELSAPAVKKNKDKAIAKAVKFDGLDQKTDLLGGEMGVKLSTVPSADLKEGMVEVSMNMPISLTKNIREKGFNTKDGKLAYAKALMRASQAIYNHATFGMDEAVVDQIQGEIDKVETQTDETTFHQGLIESLDRAFKSLKTSV